jgi:hypothetical protein
LRVVGLHRRLDGKDDDAVADTSVVLLVMMVLLTGALSFALCGALLELGNLLRE